MVAGYAIGGGHVLHLVCDLTIAADNARFGQTGPRVGSFDGGFGAGAAAPTSSARRRPRRSGSCAASTTPSRRSTWGSSTPSCRSTHSRRRPSPGAARCSRSRPSRCACSRRASTPTRTASPGIQQLAHDANLLFYASEEAREGREAYKEKRPPGLRALPRAGPDGAHLAHGGAAADAARGVAPGARRHLAGRDRRRRFRPLAFVAALLGAIFIQIGTNLSNDYSDARRGADTEDRLGPVRVTAGGLVPPRQVLIATYRDLRRSPCCAAIYLIAVAGWLLLVIGAASILAGVLYTGGPRPYGYEGLGEVFVFLFFGVVAVTGSYFVQQREAHVGGVRAARSRSGCWPRRSSSSTTCATSTPTAAPGKRTLAVRLGRERTRTLYAAMVILAFVAAPVPWLAGVAVAVAAAAAGSSLPLAVAARAHGAHARPTGRRSTARSRGHGRAAARVLRPAARRDPAQLELHVRSRSTTSS